ncbi:MAG: glycosyl hydrolase [Opitutaceae bacterium]|nr:glycosyl hydrolase [Opitutaceae bacterium]
MTIRTILKLLAFCAFAHSALPGDDLAKNFASPPPGARPWVFWFWINGNISKEGITADLEAMKRVGIGGVLWMEVSGPWWAPEGKITALSPEWHDCMQWAFRECDRLGLQFDLSVDFGYGSGGPHITPELSMQKLYWSETEVEGGQPATVILPRPEVPKSLSAWLRPGAEIPAKVRVAIEKSDGYRDVAVVAIPAPLSPRGRAYRIPELNLKDGTDWRLPRGTQTAAPRPPDAVTPAGQVLDLTDKMDAAGRLAWEPPAGRWLILRVGHASNFKMTRPSPAAAVGLECDRLAAAGIDAHYGGFLRKIFTDAGAAAGRALTHVHVDSWEAGGQNWTATFPAEFRARRGYDLRAWLPVLTGRVVGSADLSERFLWDVRTTVSEMIRDNYAARLRELARPHGIRFSAEAYGHLCIDNLAYAGTSDLPISEFWASGTDLFPTHRPVTGGYEMSTKVMASAAHTYGKPVVGAESFTAGRDWRDHPFLLKAMGDQKYCEGLNRMIFHLSAHQAYEHMIPGLTHRKWGEHIQRHNTWFAYSGPWIDYLSRSQYLLQEGTFVADVLYWFGEGAPLNVNEMQLEIPKGYDFDFCSSEIVMQLGVKNGRLVLPSGAAYRYLLLPNSDRMTLPLARKIRALVDAGARVIGGKRLRGTPGLTDFPRGDAEVEKIGAAWWDTKRVVSGQPLADVFVADRLKPDFNGGDLRYIHRRVGAADIYFISHQENRPLDQMCTFRVSGKVPELWDPETGMVRELPEFADTNGSITVPLHFEPMQSWFVVFRKSPSRSSRDDIAGRNFPRWREAGRVTGPWQVSFDAKWGGPRQPVVFAELTDWSKHADPAIHYYSGTAVYRTTFSLPSHATRHSSLFLDLGAVEVMARVRVNGRDCGIAWKPPYRVDISGAARAGKNELEVSVVNLWVNRLIGDEQLPLDGNWKDFETLLEWPEWFKNGTPRPSGRFTFTSARHYKKDSPLFPSGLFGPVTLQSRD